jgi:hypothetical protein
VHLALNDVIFLIHFIYFSLGARFRGLGLNEGVGFLYCSLVQSVYHTTVYLSATRHAI